jgi:hypothetical protein
VAISVDKLDKWFIPKQEKCDIKYSLEGLKECADKVQLDVFGSNYCECTDWNKGLGTYGDPAGLADEPIYTKELPDQAEERNDCELPGDGWKGEATTTQGILGRKTGTAAARHINVAFSPYTVHFRHWKADGDNTARLVLKPFWPQWEEAKTEPAATPTVEATRVKIRWTNAAQADYGVIEITDATGQRVHLEVLGDDKLTAGNKEVVWNKQYRDDAANGKFERTWIDDSAEPIPLKKLLFKSFPYAYKVTTFKLTPKAESLKVTWEIKNTTKLEQGRLLIFDKGDKIVFRRPLTKDELTRGEPAEYWDGKYHTGIENSKHGNEVIPEDMPYRVQIQAHSGINQAEGLAVAAMHTEVRLYVHKETFRPKDLRYDPWTAKPSLALGLGSLVPGDPPAEGDGTTWYRYQLAECGFHPGPVTDHAAARDEYHIALKEFKRSVPADGHAISPNFTRLRLDGGKDVEENVETKTAIKNIRASDKRKPFGDLTKVLANDNAPDLTDLEVETTLSDPSQDMIVWVDDRQYYTSGAGKDENNNDYFTGPNEAVAFGLKGYRGGMVSGDGKVDTDAGAIPRPWIPLRADLTLLSRDDDLNVGYDAAKVKVADEETKKAMQRAIGPLRVDWTFDEIGPDFSTINTGMAHYDKDFIRSRYYLGWTIYQKKAHHDRKDTGRKATYTNCPGGPDPDDITNANNLGGIRPDDLADYYKMAFGVDDLSLAPWRATAVGGDTQAVASVVHDHIAAGQAAGTELFEPLIGAAGAYFHPSRIAGDGYRVRAEVGFNEFTGYEFPNRETLKARYPVAPQAHSARLRVWRRSSFRGYMCWGQATGHWGDAFINEFRDHYRGSHVYFVHEGGGAAREFAISDVFDPGEPTHRRRYKKIIANNLTNATLKDEGKMSLSSDYVWPWGTRRDLGYPWVSAVNLPQNQLSEYLDQIYDATWREFRQGLLLALVKELEKRGYMRGHLMVEFDASPPFSLWKYECDNVPEHAYWHLEKQGGAAQYENSPCPAPGCGMGGHRLTGLGSIDDNALGLPAVGCALGATWLFWRGENADRLKVVWVHEVGHHRHLEHSANGPGFAETLHDSERNTKYANWIALKPPPGADGFPASPPAPNPDEARRRAKSWDRRCVMSYSDCWYGELGYFCGPCLLRNRGWKVTALGAPGTENGE